ncbi:MAG: DUF1018 domain-containing protein [Truepera sp.]|nr:DUF1018 domain-containing protein [Truepera sp.]
MNTSTHPHNRTRNRDLARIHALARDLELPDEAYRAVLYCLTGKRSAGLLDAAERRKVVAFMTSELIAKRRAAYAHEVVRLRLGAALISDEMVGRSLEALEVLGVA